MPEHGPAHRMLREANEKGSRVRFWAGLASKQAKLARLRDHADVMLRI